MLNHTFTTVARLATLASAAQTARELDAIASRNIGTADEPRSVRTIYSPRTGDIVAWNFGTFVRPAVAPIRVNQIGDETVESFLARGGQIKALKPRMARGVRVTGTIRVNPTRVITSRG